MKCPICNEGNLVLGQDAINYYSISKKGKMGKKPETTSLNDCWVECTDCHITSNDHSTDGDKLDEVLNNLID